MAKATSIIILKFGGNEIDQPGFLAAMAEAVIQLRERATPVIVHGGGKEIAELQQRLGLRPQFIDGLRVTDEDSLAVAEMVLSGRVNKRVVATLIQAGVPAVGLSGVDGGLLRVERLSHPAGDLGWVGEVVEVNPIPLRALLHADIVPVISPISLGRDGHTYNVNADHAAMALARALHADRLAFISNVPGVLVAGQCVRALTAAQAEEWIAEKIITGGMIPKVRAALEAIHSGVSQALITDLRGLISDSGTAFVADALI
ncbi:MAG: acetylglutamate kinase [Anaerolineae bacterium]|nr:acetylglutamate kinase [Anaerolineae bacterium]MDW8100387.1 acetylglutamate kinase [Anaerolineae bacterium]